MRTALVFSGGIALGAYQAGAYAELHRRQDLRPHHLAGTSVGAINAALIAGGAPEDSVKRLQSFWAGTAVEVNPLVTPWVVPVFSKSWRHASSWVSALQTRMFGRSGLFMPRLPELMWQSQPSLYDLRPLRATFDELIDFNRLNDGALRLSIATTDAETGEAVIFDTGVGDRITADHLVASCGFFPDFPPTEIGGRMLADGGFAANAPVEAVITGNDDLLCFMVDLFSPRGESPKSVEQASSRQWELLFGNQSREKLNSLKREYGLRRALQQMAASLAPDFEPDESTASLLAEKAPQSVHVCHLAYCPRDYEAGPEKAFDFSPATLGDRWRSGAADMRKALELATQDRLSQPGFHVHAVPRQAD